MLGSIVDTVSESGRRVSSAHGFQVSDKGSRENIVTSADIENERFLRSRLTSLIPGSSFVGEEGDDAPILEEGYTWIVDPIDGTMNFSRGIPEVGISVALFRDGEPYIGVVHNPFTGRMYTAEVGRGAWRDGIPIHVSDRPLEDCILSTAWCCYRKELAPRVFEVSESLYPRINDIRRIGTAAVELSMLAEGAVDLYFEIRLSPWDHAAALTCVKAAGGVFHGIEDDVWFDRPSPVLAANTKENLDALLDTVSDAFGGRTPYRSGTEARAAFVRIRSYSFIIDRERIRARFTALKSRRPEGIGYV